MVDFGANGFVYVTAHTGTGLPTGPHYVLKFDLDGNLEWEFVTPQPDIYRLLYRMGVAPSGNVYVSLRMYGAGILKVNADGTLGIDLIAPALTYYFMPVNLYITGAVGVSIADAAQDDGDETESDVGWGVNLDVGKEWWVDDNWGIGVAGRLVLGSVALDGVDADMGFAGAGVLFSATYQ